MSVQDITIFSLYQIRSDCKLYPTRKQKLASRKLPFTDLEENSFMETRMLQEPLWHLSTSHHRFVHHPNINVSLKYIRAHNLCQIQPLVTLQGPPFEIPMAQSIPRPLTFLETLTPPPTLYSCLPSGHLYFLHEFIFFSKPRKGGV